MESPSPDANVFVTVQTLFQLISKSQIVFFLILQPLIITEMAQQKFCLALEHLKKSIWNAKKHFAVTAIDRYGNESTATQEQTVQQ